MNKKHIIRWRKRTSIKNKSELINEIAELFYILAINYPETMISMEVPGNCVSAKVKDIMPYETVDGNIMLDAE